MRRPRGEISERKTGERPGETKRELEREGRK
jgi:hypothetical protein